MTLFRNMVCLCVVMSLVIFSTPEALAQKKVTIKAKELVGTWEFDYQKSRSSIKQSKKERLNKDRAELDAKVRELYQNRTYVFNDDKSFELLVSNGRSFKGSWKISKNGETLEVLYLSGIKELLRVISIKGPRLRLKSEGPDADSLLFSELYLIKK